MTEPTTDYAALSAAATPGPWYLTQSNDGYFTARNAEKNVCDFRTLWNSCQDEDDAALIVALRNGIESGDLVPRSEMDALVEAASVTLAHLDVQSSMLDSMAAHVLRAALAPFLNSVGGE